MNDRNKFYLSGVNMFVDFYKMKMISLCFVMLFTFVRLALAEEQRPEWEIFDLPLEKFSKYHYLAPEMVDIDFDGDTDLFLGTGEGYIAFYENTGTPERPHFVLKNLGTSISSSYYNIQTTSKMVVRFVDIDGDHDLDLFFGNNDGYIGFYRNDGDINNPQFVKVKEGSDLNESYFNINVGLSAAPYFIDIDNDYDYDLFIGNANGFLAFYRNEGSVSSPLFVRIQGGFTQEDSFQQIDVGEYAIPFFVDIEQDERYDLFIGNFNGSVFYYQNVGTPAVPEFKLIAQKFAHIEFTGDASVSFFDINNDAMDEFVIGNNEGKILFYQSSRARRIETVGETTTSMMTDPSRKKDAKVVQTTDVDKILWEKAQSHFKEKEYIDTLNIINQLKKSTKESKVLEQKSNLEVKSLYGELEKESFLFKDVKDYFKKAVQSFIKRKYDDSIKQFDKVLVAIPNHRSSLLYKKRAEENREREKRIAKASSSYKNARDEYNKKNLDRAFLFAKEAYSLNRENPDYFNLYTQYSNEYSVNQDKILYETSIKKAQELITQKQYHEAVQILLPLKEKYPEDLTVENLMRICSEQSISIKKMYNKRMAMIYLEKGDKFFQDKDFENAVKNYNLALNYDPTNKDIKKKLQMTGVYKKKQEQRKLDPTAVKEYFQAGLKFYTMGQYESAIKSWEKVLEIDPQHIMAAKNIEKARKMIGR